MSTAYAKKLARLTANEYRDYNGYHETSPKMAMRIKNYWEYVGFSFPGVDIAWSAIFVSYFVKKAGATAAEFKFSKQHSQFVYKAAKNAANATGVFRAFSPTVYAPKIGDIIQTNQPGLSYDFNYAKSHQSYFSHSAIVVEAGSDGEGKFVRTVGGNEGDTVGRMTVRLKSSGLIKPVPSAPKYYISVIQNLK
jgi:hypothetical protein